MSQLDSNTPTAQALALEMATALLETLDPGELLERVVAVVRAGLGVPWARAVLRVDEGSLAVERGQSVPRRVRIALPLSLGAQELGHVELPAVSDRATFQGQLGLALSLAARALGNAIEHRRWVQLAMTDCLTGLGTRRLLEESLDREQRLRRRDRRAHALIVIDVDRFKQVNDRFGHPAGDELLRGLARAVVGAVRRGDLVCRLGGDELCVLLLDEGEAGGARAVAERIRDAAAEVRLPDGSAVTLSIGLAQNHAARWATGAALLAAADEAAYVAKRAGGDAVVERDAGHVGGPLPRRMVA